MTDEELKQKYIERTQKHVDLVNYFGKKLGREFPNHDKSKFGELLEAYKFFSKPREELTKEEDDALNMATLIHITNSPHHPEYWTTTNLSGFTRKNYTPNGPIDATQMPNEYLEEMVADWCACSIEFHNTPMEWFNKVNGPRWIFTPEQQEFIRKTIEKAWDGETI